MPNWCSNTLRVSGPRVEVKQFVTLLENKLEKGAITVFDFNKIVPMPAELASTTKGSQQDLGLALLGYAGAMAYDQARDIFLRMCPSLREQAPNLATLSREEALPIYEQSSDEPVKDALAQGKLSLATLEKYGALDWYEWSLKHWGTKWNACDPERQEPTFDGDTMTVDYRFDTAWSFPEPVLVALAARFPALTFDVTGDEESGAFYVDGAARQGVFEFTYHNGLRSGGPYDCGVDDEDSSDAPAA